MIYSYDALGAPDNILDDTPLQIAETWDGQTVYAGDTAYEHLAYKKTNHGLITVSNIVFEDDIYDYLGTLEKADLLEIVTQFSTSEIIEAANMEGVKSPWRRSVH